MSWPQAIPEGLPPFPGAGWEFDLPTPPAVHQRAAQLVDTLWRQGSGAYKTEQTAGRWITYRAEVVASGKRGVVAYRVRGDAPAGAAPALPSSPSSPRRTPSSAMSLPDILTATAGWPSPMAGGGSVDVVAGRWYQWSARVDLITAGPPPADMAAGIARGLAAAGAVNVVVSGGPPYQVTYKLRATSNATVPLGVAIRFSVDGVDGSITFLSGSETTAPAKPPEKNPGQVSFPITQQRDLKQGDRGEDVKIVQRKLGIDADGIFGAKTRDAVITFQREHGLAPDQPLPQLRARGFGAVKQATWRALFPEWV